MHFLVKISNLLPTFLLVLIASAFGSAPALAGFTLQPNIQEVKGAFFDDKSSFSWLNPDPSNYLIQLISEHRDTAAALILSHEPENFGRAFNFSFEFRKNERGLVFKQTANPVVRVEYIDQRTGKKLYKTVILESMKREDADQSFTKATALGLLTDRLPEKDQNSAVVNRIAVVARAENVGVVQAKFADFDLRRLLINGIGFNPLTVKLDAINSKSDPLTNF